MHDSTLKPINLSHSRIVPRRGSSVMDNTELLESFDFACKVKNLTPASHKCYAERLTYLVRFADSIGKKLDAITHHDIQTYIMSIIDGVSAETVNGRIRVYRTFYGHLFEEGLVAENPMTRIKMLRAPKKVKPVLSLEIVRLCSDNTFYLL